MQFVTWKLNWIDGYGYGPESLAFEHGLLFQASAFTSNDVILGKAYGDIDPVLFSEFDLELISETEALDFAQSVESTAFITEDGDIAFVRKPIGE